MIIVEHTIKNTIFTINSAFVPTSSFLIKATDGVCFFRWIWKIGVTVLTDVPKFQLSVNISKGYYTTSMHPQIAIYSACAGKLALSVLAVNLVPR